MKVWEPLVCCHCQCGSIKSSAVLVGKHVWCPAGVTIIRSREVLRLYCSYRSNSLWPEQIIE